MNEIRKRIDRKSRASGPGVPKMKKAAPGWRCPGNCPAGVNSFPFAIFFLFWLLHYFQIFTQGVEAGSPDLPVQFYPIRYLIELLQPGFTITFAALLFHDHQAAFREDLHMLVDRRTADIEILCHR